MYFPKEIMSLTPKAWLALRLLCIHCMKTQMLKKLFLVVSLLQITALFMSCSSGGGGGAAATPAVSYYLANNVCYNNLNQPVTTTLCGTNGYAYNQAGACINTATQQIAASPTYCTATTTTATAGYGLNGVGQCVLLATGQIAPSATYCGTTGAAQVCIGQYKWLGPAGEQIGMCQTQQTYMGVINNCSGYTLINSAGQTVLCQ